MLRTIDRNPTASTATELARHVCDLLVCLVISVILVRSFQIEGYMISTGSMAPGLLGYHKQVVCPTCQREFQVGVAFDESVMPAHDGRVKKGEQLCTCPNCGQSTIDISFVPRNQGDQLLVNKGAFLLRHPDRFEPVVFRNPAKPTQAYVKRVAGLPGESIQIRGGDVFVNDRLIRKSFSRQLGFRIPVYDTQYLPNDEFEPQTRWIPTPGWSADGPGFLFEPVTNRPAWLDYTHVIRSGGRGDATVELTDANVNAWRRFEAKMAEFPSMLLGQVHFDSANGNLVAVGAIDQALGEILLNVSKDEEWQAVAGQLIRDSRIQPISDFYAYNGRESDHEVSDLMLGLWVDQIAPDSTLVIQIQSAYNTYQVVLPGDTGKIELRKLVAQGSEVLHLGPTGFNGQAGNNRPFLMEVSTFDRQVVVAIDGQPVFDAVLESTGADARSLPPNPIRIGATGGKIRIQRAVIYRDVFYTEGRGINGISSPYKLGDDEYFMLGDNSPVSSDSRSWKSGAVNERMLVGKPFVVHLPSKPGKLGVGSRWRYIRMPDWSRVRFVK